MHYVLCNLSSDILALTENFFRLFRLTVISFQRRWDEVPGNRVVDGISSFGKSNLCRVHSK